MKLLSALLMTLSLSFSVQASDLNQTALETLLSTPNLQVTGDVHSYETFDSIYQGALEANARIENECRVKEGGRVADCILWINFSPIGETAVEYKILLPSGKLFSQLLFVSRGA